MRKTAAFFLLLLAACTSGKRPKPALEVNAIGCSLFDGEGKLLKKYLGWTCAFFPNGRMLIGDGFTLTFYDEKMQVVWSRDVHNHHMITFDPESGLATVIASRILNGHQRIDRLEVYDIEGGLRASYNFSPEQSITKVKQTWDMPVFPYVDESLTIVESFYRIGKNTSNLPYLAEGNFLAYDAAGRLYFFDPALKGIVHTMDLRQKGLAGLRDIQVTGAGNLLLYNSGNQEGGKNYTSLEERDPATLELKWSYKANPPASFFGKYEGNVQILPNGNILYSVVMDEFRGKDRKVIPESEKEDWMDVQGMHRSFEITRAGSEVWKMVNDGSGLSGMPNVVKRYDLAGYLEHKGRY